MNSTIQDVAKAQVKTNAEKMHNFAVETFLRNIIYQAVITIIIIIIYKYALLDYLKLKGYDFIRGQKCRIQGLKHSIRIISSTIWNINTKGRLQEQFIRTYGFEIFDFINFQRKLLSISFLFFGFTLVLSVIYNLVSESPFDFYDFWIGNSDFKKHSFFITSLAFVFACIMFYTIEQLKRECKQAHTHLLSKANEEPESYNGILMRSVFLSIDDAFIEKTDLKNEISKIVNSPNKDCFYLLLFPKIHKTWSLVVQLRKLIEKRDEGLSPNNILERFMDDQVTDTERYYRENVELLENKIRQMIAKPVKYLSQAMIVFYHFDDLKRYYQALKDNKPKNNPRTRLESVNMMIPVNPIRAFSKKTKSNYLCSYNDFIVGHIHKYKFSYRVIQLLTYTVMTIFLVYITTPLAALKNYAPIFLSSNLSKNIAQKVIMLITPLGILKKFSSITIDQAATDELMGEFISSKDGKYIAYSIFPFILIGVNILLCVLIERIGLWQKFPKHGYYHHFVFTTFYVYLMVNLFLMPGLLSGSSSSLFELLLFSQSRENQNAFNYRVYNSGTFFSSLIIQASIIQLISNLLMIVPFFKARLSYSSMYRHFKRSRKNNSEKQINDVFQFGYNYSMDCVMFTLVYVFGLHQPVILFSGFTYFLLKIFSISSSLTLIFKEQVYMKTKIYDCAVWRLVLSVPLSFFVLAIKFYYYEQYTYFFVNFGFLIATSTIAFYTRHKTFSFSDLVKGLNRSRFSYNQILVEQELTSAERIKIKSYFLENVVDSTVRGKLQANGALDD